MLKIAVTMDALSEELSFWRVEYPKTEMRAVQQHYDKNVYISRSETMLFNSMKWNA